MRATRYGAAPMSSVFGAAFLSKPRLSSAACGKMKREAASSLSRRFATGGRWPRMTAWPCNTRLMLSHWPSRQTISRSRQPLSHLPAQARRFGARLLMGGLTPLGLQLDLRNSARVKPFVQVNAGGLLFTESVPLPRGRKVCFRARRRGRGTHLRERATGCHAGRPAAPYLQRQS